MGRAETMSPGADVVALEHERLKRSDSSDGELSTAGGMLRAAREALGLDIPALAERTKIRTEHLEAIEAMEIGQLPAQPYTMGFVRAYAREVELPEEPLMDRFRQQAGYARPVAAPKVKKARQSRETVDGSRELSVLALVAILAFILWSAWTLLEKTAPEETGEVTRFAFSKDDRQNAVVPAGDEPSLPPSETGEETLASPPPQTAQAPDADSTDPDAASISGDGEAGSDAAADEAPAAANPGATDGAAGDRVPTRDADPVGSAGQVPEATEAAGDGPAEARPAPAEPEPVVLRRLIATEPVYPPLCESEAADVETVSVRYSVNRSGLPVGAEIASSTNPCFNGAAIAALVRWRFDPATVTARNSRRLTAVFDFQRPY